MIKKFIKWGDRWPITYHAILFPPVGAGGAGWALIMDTTWPWAIATGLFVTVGVLAGQEYADQRAHDRIQEHLEKLDLLGIHESHEDDVWSGADWRDVVGGIIGGIIGGVAVVRAVYLWL